MSWRLRSIAGEAVRNFLTAPLRSLVLVGLVASLIGSLVLAELAFTDDLIMFTQQYERNGGYIAVATSSNGLSATRCEHLNDRIEIVAAGGVAETGSGRLATAPATLVSTAAVTTGMLSVWDPTSRQSTLTPGGSAVGRALATELSVRAGTTLNLDSTGPVPIGLVVDTEDRNPYVSRWLLTIRFPIGAVDECWVEFKPDTFGASLPYLQTLFSDAGQDLSVRPWITLDDFARNPTQELASRVQRFAWILVTVLTSLIVWLMIWFRRSELGLYRALGTTKSALLLLIQSEIVTVVALALPIGIAWATLVHTLGAPTPTDGQLFLSIRSATMAAAASTAIAPLGVLLVGRRALLNLLKDR